MGERTRGRDPESFGQVLVESVQAIKRGSQIGFPDVAPVDDADRQHLGCGQPVDHLREFRTAAHGVDMQAGDRQCGGYAQVFAERAKVGGEQQFHARAVQRVVGALECDSPRRGQVERQDGLVDLHPVDAHRFQPREDLAVHRQQAVEQVQAIKARHFFLAQIQEGERADQHRLGRKACGLRFGYLVEQPAVVESECRVGTQFRHEVVVIGVEPLGHFHGVAVGIAACQLEILSQPQLGAEAKARRRAAQQRYMGEHGVVIGKVADADVREASRRLTLPVGLADATAHRAQCSFVNLAAPEGFECKFQFAPRADARHAQSVCPCHGGLPMNDGGIIRIDVT